jgi:hypothetical protein
MNARRPRRTPTYTTAAETNRIIVTMTNIKVRPLALAMPVIAASSQVVM